MGDAADDARDAELDEFIEEFGHPDTCGRDCPLCYDEDLGRGFMPGAPGKGR